MKLLPLAALSGAAVLSTIAITDALWQGFLPAAPAPWSSKDGHAWMIAGMNFGHAMAYLLMAAVLIRSRARLDSGGFVRWVRRLLVMTFALFAAIMIWGLVTGATPESLGSLEAATTILFFALLLLPIVLGFALLRRRELRLPAILLAGSLVPFVVMMALSEATSFAHPAYAEALALFGVALLPFALESVHSRAGAAPGAAQPA